MSNYVKPFRGNIAKREQIGRLLEREAADLKVHWVDMDLLLWEARCTSAKVVARSDASRLVFVGRSAENLFDYLSGAFHDVRGAPPFAWFAFSGSLVPRWSAGNLRAFLPILDYLESLGLDPRSIATSPHPVRFVDVVASGGTFGAIVELLRFGAKVQKPDWNVVQRRIGFIGLTERSKNRPNTWRWQQQRAWVRTLEKTRILNVSLHPFYWHHIANFPPKAKHSHSWLPEHRGYNQKPEHLNVAPAIARALFDAGRTAGERNALAAELSKLPEMRYATCPRAGDMTARCGRRLALVVASRSELLCPSVQKTCL
jgi:hypothetical protein